MGFVQEFKEFAMKGNVMDMAVGIIIGAEFGKIVNSVVNDILMPPLGKLIGGVDFTKLAWVLPGQEGSVDPAAIMYGNFIQNVINFLIIAFAIFLMIKGVNHMKKKQEENVVEDDSHPTLSLDQELLTEIRDLMKKQPSA